MERESKGHFTQLSGGYMITDTAVEGNWEYIYQNRDVLLRVDQFGVVNAQANPVNDIMLFRRETNEKYSKWRVWVQREDETPVNNFAYPRISVKPQDGYIKFLPQKAEYFYDFGSFTIFTEVFIPSNGTHVCMAVTVKNTSDSGADFTITPVLFPYVNSMDYAAWDRPEWYNNTSVAQKDDKTIFYTKKLSPKAKLQDRRLVTFAIDGIEETEIRAETFLGLGTFDFPDGLQKPFLWKENDVRAIFDFNETTSLAGFPFIYAGRKKVHIGSGEKHTITQVLSMQDKAFCGNFNACELEKSLRYFSEEVRKSEKESVKQYYQELFSRRQLKTDDETFDRYVNNFLPLQLSWVASLDRGWPTGMRGVRDAANDFMGVMLYDEKWAREILLSLYSNQRTDGWLPRQVTSTGNKACADLRPYSDSGAFLMEFLHEYLALTGDMALLDERISWLDSDETATVYEHLKKSLEHYLAKDNIGEHGLVKIYGGDWLDSVGRAGLKGIGESVMVSCQLVMGLESTAKLMRFLNKDQRLADEYLICAETLKKNIYTHAFNAAGFYSSVFTDERRWLFSDCDEDGEERFYGPSNYYAIIAGAAEGREKGVLDKAECLRSDVGYLLFSPAMGRKPMSCVGRMGSGDQAIGMWENGNVYNHSQGFRIRALAKAGMGDRLYETLLYMFPYDEKVHPLDVSLTPPYAILNCYQNQPLFKNRGGSPFLTGSIAMAERAVYSWMLGIQPDLDKLRIIPCLKSGNVNIQTKFILRNKQIEINYSGNNTGNPPKIYLNGKLIKEIPYSKLKAKNTIKIIYE